MAKLYMGLGIIFRRVNSTNIVFPQELSYLSSVLHRQKNKPAEEVINLLNEAVDAHFASLKVT